MSVQTRNTLLLVLAAAIWGTAFAVQSTGEGIGPFTFLAGRGWLAVLFLLGLNAVMDAQARRRGEEAGWPTEKQEKKTLWLGGFWCGTVTFIYFVSFAGKLPAYTNTADSLLKLSLVGALSSVVLSVFVKSFSEMLIKTFSETKIPN